MIPYDDLVAALAGWRAKQGLPVSGAATAVSTPTFSPPAAPGAPQAMTGSGPSGKASSGSGPKRAAPPAAPQPGSGPTSKSGSGKTASPVVPPPPSDTIDVGDVDDHETLSVEDHALETVEGEGDEFNAAFGNLTADGDESTSIGSAPGPRDSFGGATSPAGAPPPRGGNRNDDW